MAFRAATAILFGLFGLFGWVLVLVSATPASASFVTIAGSEVTFCSTSTICYPPSNCEFSVEDLQTAPESCSAHFSAAGPYDLESSSAGMPFWEVNGRTAYRVDGDIAIESAIDAFGVRWTDQQFSVSGSYALHFAWIPEAVGLTSYGSAEIAVIRFAGDPADLVGLLPTGAQDLVTAGLIQESDILYVMNAFDHSLGSPTDFSFDVDVTGIQNDELFIMTTAIGDVPEPDQSMMLAAGVVFLILIQQRRERLRRPIQRPVFPFSS